MSIEDKTLNQTKTLSERLSEGRLPVGEGLRYAMQLADALRKLHEKGKVHGAVIPSNVAVTEAGVELLPAPEGLAGILTPYTAPEVVQGRPADERSDIFSFGAVLFEMLSGRRAFEGESRVLLAANITNTPTPSSGSLLVDRVIGPCLQKDPAARSSRMQRVIMELKMLSVAARRAEMPGSGARRETVAEIAAVRAELQQLELRLAARLHDREEHFSGIERSAQETVSALRAELTAVGGELAANRQQASEHAATEKEARESIKAQISTLASELAANRQQIAERAAPERELAAANAALKEQLTVLGSEFAVHRQQVAERVAAEGQAAQSVIAQLTTIGSEIATVRQEGAERVAGQREIAAANEAIVSRVERGFEALDGRISQIEHSLEELRGHTSQFERNLAADLVDVEQTLKTQSVAIESARTAMSQTDDLVERVVEALESLQMAVMDQGVGVEHAPGTVN